MKNKIDKMGKLVSVVVCDDKDNFIVPLLDSFMHLKSTKPDEIIIIDVSPNHSNRIPDRYSKLPVTAVHQKEASYGMAKNTALEIAMKHGAEWVHFISNFGIFSDATFPPYLKAMSEGADFLQGSYKSIDNDWFSRYREKNVFKEIRVFIEENNKYRVRCLKMNFLISLKTLSELGGFDPHLTHTAEDLDLTYRAIGKVDITYCPESLILSAADPKQILRYVERLSKATNQFVQKHIGELYQLEKILLDNPEGCIDPIAYQKLSFFCSFLMREDALKLPLRKKVSE